MGNKMNWKLPLFKTYWDEADVEAVSKVIRRGTYWADGPEIKEFESKLSDYLGRKYVVTFNSGTSALHSVLLAHGIDSGEVIVPSFTFIATSNSVVLSGARPVFAEIEDETYGLSADDVSERITPKTKAIMPIHFGGCPCRDIPALRQICDDNNLLLIEDAAESLGSHIDGKKVGTYGDSAMFSLCQNKVITTGEGGFITTDSREVYEKLKLIRSHGRVEKNEDYFSTTKEMDYVQVGYNYRMPTMSAALGLSQLNKINKNIERRRSIAEEYSSRLSKVKKIKTLSPPPNFFHVYQMYTIQLPSQNIRDSLQNHLSSKEIMSRVYFHPLHLKSLYEEKFGYSPGDLPKTEEISKKVLTLPFFPDITKENIDFLIDSINSFQFES